MTPHDSATMNWTAADLEGLERIASEIGALAVADEARVLRERLAAGRFYVVSVGQFKRGKSTLINALVGESVLPTGVTPVTAVPTVLRDGAPAARVRLQDDSWRDIPTAVLAEYVTEEGNPENAKGVRAAEVFLHTPLLRAGLCLVDTPGIGSVFEANSAAARAFVPQIDAALVVVGADPPISGEELALVADVAKGVEELIFVLNKMDRLPLAERQEAVAFTERVLRQRLGRPVAHVFEVSALAALRSDGDAGDWESLVTSLEHLTVRRGCLVTSAARRGVGRLGARLEQALHEEHAALLRPVEDSEGRIRALREIVTQVARSLAEVGPLVRAEQMRLRCRFEERRLDFLKRMLPEARLELVHRLEGMPAEGRRIRRAEALATADALAEECLSPWLAESEQDAEASYRAAMTRFAELGTGALAELSRVAGVEAGVLSLDAVAAGGYQGKRTFRYHHLLHRHDPPGPWRQLADALLPVEVSRHRVIAAADRYLADLLEVNASRVEGDLNERVEEGRRRLQAEVTALLGEVSQAAERALARARAARSLGEEAIRAALAATEQRLAALAEIMDQPAEDRPAASGR